MLNFKKSSLEFSCVTPLLSYSNPEQSKSYYNSASKQTNGKSNHTDTQSYMMESNTIYTGKSITLKVRKFDRTPTAKSNLEISGNEKFKIKRKSDTYLSDRDKGRFKQASNRSITPRESNNFINNGVANI